MNIFKKLRLEKVAIAFLLATFLFTTTACNSGDKLGARPEVSPVQLGGQNNPHKAGGDNMTQYKSPANDSLLDKGNASLQPVSILAAANKSKTTYPTDDGNMDGLLYSDSDEVESLDNVDDLVSPQKRKQLLDPGQIPAVKQPAIDRSNPDNKLLEKAAKAFEEAGDFSAN